MNRLIIIGNGFDIAHGIKSSFKNFIEDYFCNVINTFYTENSYSDKLFEIKFKHAHNVFSPVPDLIKSNQSFELIKQYIQEQRFLTKFHSLLLNRAFDRINQLNWVDLEVEFFNVLTATKHAYKNSNQKEAIQNVNSQLDFLKAKLVEYLDNQEKQFSNGFNKAPLIECFCEEINKNEIVTTSLKENKLPENLYFLNFNYTRTFEDYLSICKEKIPSNYNYIHGDLSGINGKPIFGFGDEFDKKYIEFEHEKNNELFKHIKSFEYLQTKNFYLLTRFIESNGFQVHIYGHSCGISDRTMLNQIFEHDNCKSIKVFYHKIDENNNDFTDKTYEISRHFKDKIMLRKKLVPLELSTEMPQPDNK
ncbi:AbiH family protein [Tenacibaculum soleae]|uniref:AbiH family protein n=1 Tax=Tenacibaculum soleae TaxID=447689 RepID=UPI002300F884|nr:AbiH family protein [Tenacibaculum soleae]